MEMPVSAITDGHAPDFDPAALARIVADLLHRGWVVIDQAVPPAIVEQLRRQAERVDDTAFTTAGVGRDDDWRRADSVRRDRVYWLDPDTAPTRWYFSWIESLRLGLNRGLFLGLFDYECHLAWYEPGAFYSTHVDAFRGDDNRKISTVLYLNENWEPSDGGELVLYAPIGEDADFDPAAPRSVAAIIAPTGGTLVCFLSEEVPHEVLDARADRHSIAGWFRVNANGRRLDPPVFPLA